MEDQDYGIGSRVRHPEFGEGVVINVKNKTYTVVFIRAGKMDISRLNNALETIEMVEPDTDLVSMSDIERSLINIIKRYSDIQETVPLGQKWIGGKIVLHPGNTSLKPKEISIDNFFHKVIMLRDRVRVMEQRINAHPHMNDEEKVNLQQYITRIYGSLTTFNDLFKNKEDQFVGDKGKENNAD
ncbi:MAG: hypothetical protein IPO27_00460 [Bacteroidetes bacterium]|nr:hypothetical protein [Bacteroidota bacterium]